MRVSRKISIYRAQRSQQGCSLSLGMLRLAEPPTGRARLRSSLKSPRNPITPFETSRVSTLHPGLYKNLREGARRVIGATAKPLYPIDGKAAGFDRRNPKTSLFEGGGPSADGGRSKQAVEGVFRRWKSYSFPKLKYMRQNAEPCACLRRILLNFIFNSARSVNVPAFFGREHPPRTQEI